ncbi:hypothetical protein [Singulisphaera sp. PoT]|uniref:hypothetical protein n=1 Tax=Singulisphaera sp. PoT TaxID=3411797 RepID=UPI003BF5C3C7
MGIAEHDPRRWDRPGSWAVESRDAALARLPEFGRRFFQAVIAEFEEAVGAHFLRWSEQPGDVYALFELPGGGAGVQIDPDLGYIIVYGPTGKRSTGTGAPIRCRLRSLISAVL